jgi:CBS domain-containing protein
MMTARQLLNEKGHDLWTIHPNNSILEAMKVMIERDVGSLLVMSDARPMGIITERECARSVVSKENSLMDTMVWAIMAPPVPSIGPNESIEKCMTLMTERRVRYLPVLKDGSPIGILSIGDLVKCIIGYQHATINQLESYIHGQMAN